jgi:hypothetical protein
MLASIDFSQVFFIMWFEVYGARFMAQSTINTFFVVDLRLPKALLVGDYLYCIFRADILTR